MSECSSAERQADSCQSPDKTHVTHFPCLSPPPRALPLKTCVLPTTTCPPSPLFPAPAPIPRMAHPLCILSCWKQHSRQRRGRGREREPGTHGAAQHDAIPEQQQTGSAHRFGDPPAVHALLFRVSGLDFVFVACVWSLSTLLPGRWPTEMGPAFLLAVCDYGCSCCYRQDFFSRLCVCARALLQFSC